MIHLYFRPHLHQHQQTLSHLLDNDSDSSEDPLALEALEQALLSVAGIDQDSVQFTLDQALEYVHSAQTKDSAEMLLHLHRL